jgi:copper(I)-binding protein
MRTRALLSLALAGGLVLGAAACGDSDDEEATTTTAAASAEGIAVSDAWCRTSPAMTTAGACYLQIENGSGEADALVAASAPSPVAARTELHETAMAEGPGTTMGGTGMMTMTPVDRIELPAGQTVSLEPGGYHVMLLELAAPLEAGSAVALTLSFERAPEQTVDAEVRSS